MSCGPYSRRVASRYLLVGQAGLAPLSERTVWTLTLGFGSTGIAVRRCSNSDRTLSGPPLSPDNVHRWNRRAVWRVSRDCLSLAASTARTLGNPVALSPAAFAVLFGGVAMMRIYSAPRETWRGIRNNWRKWRRDDAN